LAESASVTTPAEIFATSGSAITLPVADTLTVRSVLSLSAAMLVSALRMAAAAIKAATAPAERMVVLRILMLVLTLSAARHET
jgi:hypothetical protein